MARQRVTSLANVGRPRLSILSEAIGETSDVTGTIIFNETGSVLSKSSVLTVGVDGLTSDESREDGFLRRSSIQTSRFPDATFSINGTEGLDWPLPSEGSVSFTLLGNMTIRDVSTPSRWTLKPSSPTIQSPPPLRRSSRSISLKCPNPASCSS